MLTMTLDISRIFLSPLVGVAVSVLAILSYAIGDRFTAGEFAPWLVFPALVLLFFVLSSQAWLRAGFYAAVGLIAAHVVMALLGFERHGIMSHAGHHSTTAVLHILFEVSVDIALAIGFVLMLKRIAPHTYEGDVIATYDVERVLNWRLAATLMALPFYVFAVRFMESALAGVIFGMSFEAWPVLGADLVGYFMFLPGIVGIILTLTGAPRLEPELQPLNVLVVGYIALVGVLTELGVLFGSQVSAVVLIIPFGVNAILATLFPTMHVAGHLLLVNFAGLTTASQYAGLTKRELSVTIIGISVVVVLVMLLRVIAQVKMNRANARVHSALERSDVFLRAGTGAYIIHNEDFGVEYLSDPMKEMIGIEDGETVTSVPRNLLGLSQEQTAAMRQQLRDMKSDAIYRDEKIYDFYPLKSTPRKVKIIRRWILDPITQTRFMSATYEDVTDKLRLEAERADQEEVLKAFVYEGPQYCFVEDEEFKIRLISEGAAELIAGKSSVELIGKDPLEYFGLDDQKRIMAARSERDERLERGETVVSNTPLTFKLGEETVKVRIQVKLLHLPSGAVMRGVIFDDITEVEAARQQAEEYLRAGTGAFQIQNERYETLYVSDKVLDLVSRADIDDINSADTAIMAKFWPDCDDAYWVRHREEIDALATGELWESPEPERVLTSSGEERYIIRTRRWFRSAHSGGRLLYTALQDVTDINKALEVANTFLDSQLTAFTIQREDFSFYYVSDEFKAICGVSKAEEIGDPATGFWDNRNKTHIETNRDRLLAMPTGAVHEGPEAFIHVKSSGERVAFKVRSKWIEHPTEQGRLLITSFEDITALQAAIVTARSYLEGGVNAYTIQDETYATIYTSDEFKTVLGYKSLSELQSWEHFYADYDEAAFYKRRREILATLPIGGMHDAGVVGILSKSGKIFQMKERFKIFLGPTGQRYMMTAYEDVTALENALEEARSYLEGNVNAYVVQDEAWKYVYASEQFLDLIGAEDLAAIPDSVALFPKIPEKRLQDLRADWLSSEFGVLVEHPEILSLQCLTGETKQVKRLARKIKRQSGEGFLTVVGYEDQTELQRALKAANTFLDSQLTPMAIQREDFSWYFVSDALKQVMGISSIEDFKDPANGFWAKPDRAGVLEYRKVLRALPTGVVSEPREPYTFVKATGERLFFKIQYKWIDNPNGDGRLLLSSAENITELILHQEEIEAQKAQLQIQAFTDPLTGVWNRLGLNDQLKRDEHSARAQDLGIYLIDIDYFKSVNDAYSHRTGDQLLREIARTLRDVTQESDIVARLGGEEFMVVSPWAGEEAALLLGREMRQAIGRTKVYSDGHSVSRTTSIGIAYLGKSDELDAQMKLADLALSEVKERGRDAELIADAAFLKNMEANGAFITEAEIEEGIIAQEFCYYLQPIYNTQLNAYEGFETLIRWVKSDGSVIPPYMFLNQFNKVFFKTEFWEYRQQMRHDVLAHLKAQPDAYVSWNYELDQFTSDAFVERLITQAQGLRDRYSNPLVIEISERAINARLDMVEITKNLQKVRDAGFKIALDDFGTEQSNVNRLMRFPIDVIKFDKSLIDDAGHDRRAQATIAALGKLAQGLDIKVIAEGVETAAQAEILNQLGLTIHQGYFYSKPVPPAELKLQAAE